MRITAIIENNTSYGSKVRDVILTTGASTDIGHHYFSGDLLRKLTSENDVVIAGGEPLDQFYPLITFLELLKKNGKKVWLVTKRKVLPNKQIWRRLADYVEVVEEHHSGTIINLPESVKNNEIIIWEE